MGLRGSKGTNGNYQQEFEEAKALLSKHELDRLKCAFDRSALSRKTLTERQFVEKVLKCPRDAKVGHALFECFASSGEMYFEQMVICLVAFGKTTAERRKQLFQQLADNELRRALPAEWVERGLALSAAAAEPSTSSLYSTLAAVTHLSEEEIELVHRLWPRLVDAHCSKITSQQFAAAVCPPLSAAVAADVFRAFDENGDGMIDFRELVCGLSASCRGPRSDRFKFVFKMLERQADGSVQLSKKKITALLADFSKSDCGATSPMLPRSNEGAVTLAEFLCWAVQNAQFDGLLDCLEEIGHICFGLRPSTVQHELRLLTRWSGRLTWRDCDYWMVVPKVWWKQLEKETTSFESVEAVDTRPLLVRTKSKLPSLTREGGLLHEDLKEDEYVLASAQVWTAITHWHSLLGPAVGRYVIAEPKSKELTLELYPITVTILRHKDTVDWSTHELFTNPKALMKRSFASPPYRVPACTATFSLVSTVGYMQERVCAGQNRDAETSRLWLVLGDDSLMLLDDDQLTVAELQMDSTSQVLLEVRSADLTWPEEVRLLERGGSAAASLMSLNSAAEHGATGLNNLGNSCFMNSAIQCVRHTRKLTDYFIADNHVRELKRKHPAVERSRDGGVFTNAYSELLKDLWSGKARVVAPKDIRNYRPFGRFRDGRQHDCQEYLSVLLDCLHEDLNEVVQKPYVTLRDSDGRPDAQVADEAWDNHMKRDRSVVTELFHGQLRSAVVCAECRQSSLRFDPFTFLSLPLPVDTMILLFVTVVRLDGSRPVRHGFRLPDKAKVGGVLELLAERCGLKLECLQLINARPYSSTLIRFDNERTVSQVIEQTNGYCLNAFEFPANDDDDDDGKAEANGSVPPITPHVSSGQLNIGRYAFVAHRRLVRHCEQLCGRLSRRQEYEDVYFLAHDRVRPTVFGSPLVVATGGVSARRLYELVWRLVERYVDSSQRHGSPINRAIDADEDATAFPFVLRQVDSDFAWCSRCPWHRFCRGCPIDSSDDAPPPLKRFNCHLAVDWDPLALHLRFDHSAAQAVDDDVSVVESQSAHHLPTSLNECLQDFTKPEELTLDEAVFCKHCKSNRPAFKELGIWKLPPILIVHLKRFVCVGGRWVKSTKQVDCPLVGFDPSQHVVSGLADGLVYDCFAFANHYGAMGAGHYVAFAKNFKDTNWYLFNDSRVKLSEPTETDLRNAYLLFYELRATNSRAEERTRL